MDLNVSDILLMISNFEPSRTKVWEMVRRYDPIQMAAFLYLLENVRVSKKCPITLDCEEMLDFCGTRLHDRDVSLPIMTRPVLRIDRAECETVELFLSTAPMHVVDNPYDTNILEIVNRVRTPERFREPANIYASIVIHNLGTSYYQKFLTLVKHLLFSDNLHFQRNEIKCRESVVVHYLQFYKMLTFSLNIVDPRNFRYIILPRPERIYVKPNDLELEYIAQPLYQGLHVVVNSDGENAIKCYNKYAELLKNLLPSVKLAGCSCTFEAVVLPTDARDKCRSWRYWRYRQSCLLYIVDVFRLGNSILVNSPFNERVKYARQIRHPRIRYAPSNKQWDELSAEYHSQRDMYSPIVGIVLRPRLSTPNRPPYVFRHPVRIVFDFIEHSFVSLENQEHLSTLNTDRMYFDLEMADTRATCTVYGHTFDHYYLCVYNRRVHQFQHAATMQRMPYDVEEPKYRIEPLIVLNNRVKPRGLLYLRVYFDKFRNCVGYETKVTLSRYDIPLRSILDELFLPNDNDKET